MECKLCKAEIKDRVWDIQALTVHNRLINLLNIQAICERCENECLRTLNRWVQTKKMESATIE